jgi:urea transport system substrate-binding protein
LHNRLKANGERPSIKVIKEYGDLPLVECYPSQINQVFMNLLGNAIDALEELNVESSNQSSNLPYHSGNGNAYGEQPANLQPATPWIRIRTEVSSTNHVTVQIADNGSGMTEEVKEQLFDAFFTTKPRGKGTGLGLSISYQIVVEKHGGSLRCESALGKGTEFSIEIPVRQSSDTRANSNGSVSVVATSS